MRFMGNLLVLTLTFGYSIAAMSQPGDRGQQTAQQGSGGQDCPCAHHRGDIGPGVGHGMGPDMGDEEAGPAMGPAGKGLHSEHLLAGLDLTKEQREKIKVIRDKFKPQTKSMREEIGPMHEAMKKLFESGAPVVQIRAQHQKIETAMQRMMDLRFDMILAIYDILTPEQKVKWGQHMPRVPGK